MASVIGREVHNPLAVINNSVYFIKTKLRQSPQADAKIFKHIEIVESEVRQVKGVISEILAFFGVRPLKPVATRVNTFLGDVLSAHSFPSDFQVVREFEPRDPMVNIDRDEMKLAVGNLLCNAVEVMPNGGNCRVTTHLLPGDWCRIDISDTGPGIPPEILEKIFMPFFTTKARRLGLGLAVVRKVVERHQGKLDVETQVGKGAVFRISLPVWRDPPHRQIGGEGNGEPPGAAGRPVLPSRPPPFLEASGEEPLPPQS